MVPLLVQEIQGSLRGSAGWTGGLAAISGVSGLISGIVLGRLADRYPAPLLGKASSVGAGLLMIPQGLANGFLLLFSARFGMMFCSGGLDPVFQIWLAKVTPEERRGFVFGWASSARSIGWVGAASLSGLIAAGLGIRAIYFIGGALFFAIIPLIIICTRKVAENNDLD
jgi:MFS family permease